VTHHFKNLLSLFSVVFCFFNLSASSEITFRSFRY